MHLNALRLGDAFRRVWAVTLGSSSICKNNSGYSNDLLFWASHRWANLETQGGPHKPFGARSSALFCTILVQDCRLQMSFAEHKMPVGENQKKFCESWASGWIYLFKRFPREEVDLQVDSPLVKCGNRQCIWIIAELKHMLLTEMQRMNKQWLNAIPVSQGAINMG